MIIMIHSGTTKNIIVSKRINIETENVPVIKTSITAMDYYSGNEINYGDNVSQGSYMKYTINVTNEGGKPAENVKVNVTRPEGTGFLATEYIEVEDAYDTYIDKSEQIEQTIDKLNPGETKQVELVLYIESLELDSTLSLRTTVTADNVMDESSNIFENTITEGTLILKLDKTYAGNDEKINEDIDYNLKLENTRQDSLKNVSVSIYIPENMEFVETDEGEYDKNTRQLKFNLDELAWDKFYRFKTKVTNTSEPNEEIGLTAIGTFDGAEKEINSNTEVISVIDTKGFDARLESNISGRMLDTDTIEYYITVNNNSKKEATINIYDTLPKELKIEKYAIQNGTEIKEQKVSLSPNIEENVKAGDSIKATITARPYRLDKVGDIKDIENKVTIKVNGLELGTGSLTQQIEGSSNFNTEITEETKEEVEDKYSVSGKVWYDENGNSKLDNEEIGISKVTLKLYDVNKQEYMKDADGNDMQIETNEAGEYMFGNLAKGSYIVVSNYDNTKYMIVNYQVKDLSQNENNDFIKTKEGEATTDKLEVGAENIYNVNLGLTDVKNFNIAVKNTIGKVNVITNGESKTYEGEKLNAIEVNQAEKGNTTVVVEYKIEVTNEGNVDGYAKEITNQIPKGMKFISELNTDWYLTPDGNAINTKLANKIIRVGETEELELILSKELNDGEAELIHNTTEVKKTYNEQGIKEINAKSGQTVLGGGIADIVIVGKDVVKEITMTTALSLGIIALISLLGVGVYRKMNKA